MTIHLATRDELPAALTLLYDVAPEDRPAYLAHAFRLMARGELDPADFILARDAGELVGVMTCREVPGRSAIVWPPRTIPAGRANIEDELIEAAVAGLSTANVLQTFMPPEQSELALPLVRNGFQCVTRVLHLEHAGGVIAPPSELELRSSPDVESPFFQRLLQRCHLDTLDVPELNPYRTTNDLLAGYLDQSPELHWWFIITWHQEPIGIAITTPGELCFLGILPEIRGQGLGQLALMHILDRMGRACRLIVDERNWPAMQMYLRAGFQPGDEREVYLRMLD